MENGIDVSHWQWPIDWGQVKAAGYTFAYIKATEGTAFLDNRMAAHWLNAGQAGLKRGFYHFFRPGLNAAMQAAHFIIATRGLETELRPVLDVETVQKTPAGQPIKPDANNLLIWLQFVEMATGQKPMIYTAAWFFDTYYGAPIWARNYPLWCAHYSTAPTAPRLPKAWTDWSIWQYSSQGKVPGVPGACDLDRSRT